MDHTDPPPAAGKRSVGTMAHSHGRRRLDRAELVRALAH